MVYTSPAVIGLMQKEYDKMDVTYNDEYPDVRDGMTKPRENSLAGDHLFNQADQIMVLRERLESLGKYIAVNNEEINNAKRHIENCAVNIQQAEESQRRITGALDYLDDTSVRKQGVGMPVQGEMKRGY